MWTCLHHDMNAVSGLRYACYREHHMYVDRFACYIKPHSKSDPADREFLPLLEYSAESWFDAQTLAHTLESDLFQSTCVDFFLYRGLCGGLHTRICCILITFWRFPSMREIMIMCSNTSYTYSSDQTDKPWCKLIRLIHLDRFALEFCFQTFCVRRESKLPNLFPICY